MRAESAGREQAAGYYTVDMSKGGPAAGAYVLVLRAGEYRRERAVVLMR